MGKREAKARGRAIGRHENFTAVKANNLSQAISDILEEYGETVYLATEDALDAAAYALSDELKAETPGDPPHKQNFAKRWKVAGAEGKYKLMRFVGNTTVVSDKKSQQISLANIFEYSTVRGHPFIKKTFENSVDKMARAAVDTIRKEV